MWFRKTFYLVRPILPRSLVIALRGKLIRYKLSRFTDIWPIDTRAAQIPGGWTGWPKGTRFALILTHDVERKKGYENCKKLMKVEQHIGFRSSFNFVPERYTVSPMLRKQLTDNGFEVGVHGLNHDGKLYKSKRTFLKRAAKINHYLKDWRAVGFRSPAMHHNLDWIHHLNIEYDLSTFDTDPFEPQPGGMGTIFPFCVQNKNSKTAYIEMPYTLPQDFTLFILMRKRGIDIWKQKLDWIARNGGMALVIVHPDYLNFGTGDLNVDEYPISFYAEFLEYIKFRYGGQFWNALPSEVSRFWKTRRK